MQHKFYLITFLSLLCLPIGLLAQQDKQDKNVDPCDQLYEWVVFGDEENGTILEESLYQPELLISFYTQKDCRPIWSNEKDGMVQGDTLQQILTNAESEVNFHQHIIEERAKEVETVFLPLGLHAYTELDRLDVLLSDAALHYAYELKTKGETLTEEAKEKMGLSIVKELLDAIDNNQLQAYYQRLIDGEELTTITEEVSETVITPAGPVPAILDTLKENRKEEVANASVHGLVNELGEGSSMLGVALKGGKLVKEFYRNREYNAAWHQGRRILPQANQLLKNLKKSNNEGLNPAIYHTSFLEDKLKNKDKLSSEELDELDVLLTDASLLFAEDLAYGRLNPKQFGHSWNINEDKIQLTTSLNEAIEAEDVQQFFDQLRPVNPQYNLLRKALTDYKVKLEKEGDWEPVPEIRKLELGMTDDRVVAIRKRLAYEQSIPELVNDYQVNSVLLTEYLSTDDAPDKKKVTTSIKQLEKEDSISIEEKRLGLWIKQGAESTDTLVLVADSLHNPKIFDQAVHDAVLAFQQKEGLEADGIVGRNTLAAMNKNLSYRIQQLELNLERWRWTPTDFGDDYLLVNIPSFLLHIYEDHDSLVLVKKVVVGKLKHKTPVFEDLVQYLELNPYWTVPFSIATNEILPKLKRNPGYLGANNMELLAGGKSISPYSVNWAGIGRHNFRYTIRQKPGDKNALGRVKFMFPNLYNIYLHDTPSKRLFGEAYRPFSHGCVRVHKPFELAEYLLKDNPKWSPEKIDKAIARGKNKRIHLLKPRPIYILYFTTWVDEKTGEVYFYRDVYGRDKVELGAF